MKKTVLLPVAIMMLSGSVVAEQSMAEKEALNAETKLKAQKETVASNMSTAKQDLQSEGAKVDSQVDAAVSGLEKDVENKRALIEQEKKKQADAAKAQKDTYDREVAAKRDEAAKSIGAESEKLGGKAQESGEKIETAASELGEQEAEKPWWQFWK